LSCERRDDEVNIQRNKKRIISLEMDQLATAGTDDVTTFTVCGGVLGRFCWVIIIITA
jgi:hypothetical protein